MRRGPRVSRVILLQSRLHYTPIRNGAANTGVVTETTREAREHVTGLSRRTCGRADHRRGRTGRAGAAADAAGAPARPQFETNKVDGTDNVYIFRNGNHQSMFIVTKDGVIATDPIAYGRPTGGQHYVDEIKKVTDKPIKYLIYSHHHFDHIAGGKAFKDAGATHHRAQAGQGAPRRCSRTRTPCCRTSPSTTRRPSSSAAPRSS